MSKGNARPDLVRCHGVGCDEKQGCLRWILSRETGRFKRVRTFNHHGEPQCFYFISNG